MIGFSPSHAIPPHAASARPLLRVDRLVVSFPAPRSSLFLRSPPLQAVAGAGLEVHSGETVALVGESGCGKTTLGRAIAGLVRVASGSICFDGMELAGRSSREWKPLRRRLQMVFQDPHSSLNPRMRVGEIITEGLRVQGVLRPGGLAEAAARGLEEVGLPPDAMARYPHEFSGGQRQRINLARALALRPELMVCDEVVSALDVSVQAQILELLTEIRHRHALANLFITHDVAVARRLAHRVAVMYRGRVVEFGPSRAVLDTPLHPYTRALRAAVPSLEGRRSRLPLVDETEGAAPRPPPAAGCAFAPRCPLAQGRCLREMPETRRLGASEVQCHFAASSPADGNEGAP